MNDVGDVLMEYVVLCCAIGVVLLLFMQHEEKDRQDRPVSGFFNYEKGYVGLGLEWVGNVQLLHRAVATPLP